MIAFPSTTRTRQLRRLMPVTTLVNWHQANHAYITKTTLFAIQSYIDCIFPILEEEV